MSLLTAQYSDAAQRLKEANEAIRPHKDELKKLEAEMKQVISDSLQLDRESENQIAARASLENHRTHYEKVKIEMLAKLAAFEKVIEDTRTEVGVRTGAAVEVSPERVAVEKTLKAIEAELKQLDKSIQENEKKFGDREEIERSYHTKVDEYKKVRWAMDNNRKLLQVLVLSAVFSFVSLLF